MKITRQLFPFLFVCFLFPACSHRPTELRRAESLIETRPDSALQLLRQLSPNKYASRRDRALYGLLLTETLNKNILPMGPDSLLDFSIAYYQEHTDGDRLAACYLYKGRSYKLRFQYEKAMAYLLKALDNVTGRDNNLLLGRIHFDIGDIYQIQRDYSPARTKFKQACVYFRRAKSDQLAFYSLLYIGRTYHEAKDYRQSLAFFLRILPQLKDSMEQGAVLQEVGLNYYDLKQYDSAKVYLRQVINYPSIGNNKSIRYLMLADLSFDMNHLAAALSYGQQALTCKSDIRTQKNCYRVLVNSSAAMGNIPEMKKYMKLYQDCSDSIKKIDTQTKGSYIENMHSTRNEVVKTKHLLWYLSGLVLFVAGLSAFSYSRLRKRKNKQLTQTKEYHRMQKQDYHKAAMRRHREALVHKIEKIKESQSVARKKLSPAGKDLVDKKRYNDILHLDDTVYFFKLMDANMNNLVSKLKTRYNGVSDREISWCCLTLLEVPLEDILLLLDYKVEALNKMKIRLAKKLQLQYASQLTDFLHEILSEDEGAF